MTSPERLQIAKLLTGRCNNCYQPLPGFNVHAPGWNWLTPNFGPFCDECMKDLAETSKPVNARPK